MFYTLDDLHLRRNIFFIKHLKFTAFYTLEIKCHLEAYKMSKCQRWGERSWHLTRIEMSALGQATRTTLSMSSVCIKLCIMHGIWFVCRLAWRNYYNSERLQNSRSPRSVVYPRSHDDMPIRKLLFTIILY